MPADEQILVAGTSAVPLTYTVPNAVEVALLCVNATIDGTGASGAFLGTVEIISDGGVVVARCPCFTTIAAGASAEISWFRLRNPDAAATSTSPYSDLVLSNPHVRVYYKLDETSGVVCTDSGPAGVNGTYLNSPTLGQPPLVAGSSALFDAASSQGMLSGSTATFNPLGPQTIIAWIKTTQSGVSLPLFAASDDNNFRYVQLGLFTTGVAKYVVFDAGNANAGILTGATVVNDGTRHMVAGTWDSGQLQSLYIDGQLDASQTTALVGQSTRMHALEVAQRDRLGSEQFYTGWVDEVSFYDEALTAAQINALFHAGIGA